MILTAIVVFWASTVDDSYSGRNTSGTLHGYLKASARKVRELILKNGHFGFFNLKNAGNKPVPLPPNPYDQQCE